MTDTNYPETADKIDRCMLEHHPDNDPITEGIVERTQTRINGSAVIQVATETASTARPMVYRSGILVSMFPENYTDHRGSVTQGYTIEW